LMPAGGASVRLPRKVGEPLARWLMLTGELLPAEVFTGTGFIHAVAPAERFDHMVTDSIDRLRRTAGITQLHLKQLLHAIRDLPPDRALAQELAAFADHWNSADIATALHRFLSGQRPTSPT
jgi:enoyl-CoA hydratase